MDNKKLVEALKEQGIKAEYITDQMFSIGTVRIVNCNSFAKADNLSVRYTDPKELLWALWHDEILQVSEETVYQIIHRYKVLTNPFIKPKKQSKLKFNEQRNSN